MNKIMKTSVALVAAGMIGGVVASATTVSAASYKSELKTKGKLTVGLEGTYAPFSYRSDSGKLTGFEVELVKAVAKKMKLKPVFPEAGRTSPECCGMFQFVTHGVAIQEPHSVVNLGMAWLNGSNRPLEREKGRGTPCPLFLPKIR